MSIEVFIPPVLQALIGDVTRVPTTGQTIGECVNDLVKKHPVLRERLFSRHDKLANGVSIFLNGESAFPEPLAKKVHEGDKIHISFIVLGG